MIGDVNERDIRKQVAHYWIARLINMGKAVVLTVVGAVLFYGTITDKFPSDGAAIGKLGVMVVGIGIATVIFLMGIIWFLRLLRDLRVGSKEYEQALRGGVRII